MNTDTTDGTAETLAAAVEPEKRAKVQMKLWVGPDCHEAAKVHAARLGLTVSAYAERLIQNDTNIAG